MYEPVGWVSKIFCDDLFNPNAVILLGNTPGKMALTVTNFDARLTAWMLVK